MTRGTRGLGVEIRTKRQEKGKKKASKVSLRGFQREISDSLLLLLSFLLSSFFLCSFLSSFFLLCHGFPPYGGLNIVVSSMLLNLRLVYTRDPFRQ